MERPLSPITMAICPSNTAALRDEVVPRHVRQFGSARDGLREWRLQRLTAIALIPLSLYFAASILSLATADRKTAADWLASPVPAVLVILLVLAGITHALIGIRSVIVDRFRRQSRR
jgi:succinate dehydrogenase / fumarate reductase membrane anchor subunit